MKIILSFILILLFTGSFFSCSKDEMKVDSLNISVEILKFDSWINLMPGGSPTFHFAGDISITYTGKDSTEYIKMTKVEVFQNSKKLYDEIPYYNEKRRMADSHFYKDSPRDFLFGSEQNIKIVSELDTDKPVDFEFTFTSGETNKIVILNKVKVERVY